MRIPPLSRRAAVAVAVLAVVVPIGLAASSPAQESGSQAILSQDGWWNRVQGPQEDEPDSPIRDVLSPLPPPPNTVPDSGIAVGASGGDPDKVAAIGIVLEAPADAFVDRLVLTLGETEENGSNINEGQAIVLACPITVYWAGTSNGDWQNRPECDDSQAVQGERADGIWTFDLTLMGQGWVGGTLVQLGVLLVEGVEAPQSFQVSYKNIDTGTVSLDFATTGGGISGSSIFEPEPTAAPVAPAPSNDVGRAPTPTRSSPPPAATSPPPTAPAAPAGTPASQPAPPRFLDANIWGNLPVGTLLWGPLVLALAAGLAFVLGPQGRPDASNRRVGSVSRVLDSHDVGIRGSHTHA